MYFHERRPSNTTALFRRIKVEGHFKWPAQLNQPVMASTYSTKEESSPQEERRSSLINEKSPKRQRKTSTKRNRKLSHESGGAVDRYYFDSQQEFETLLNDLNKRKTVYTPSHDVNRLIVPTPQSLAARLYLNESEIHLRCVGFVSVSMQMCSRCCDQGKPITKKDKYYINELEIAKERTVLCHGCLGYMLDGLRKWEERGR